MAAADPGLANDIIFVYLWTMTTGQLMRKARERIGKRQRDIADEVGRTQPTVHAWETDRACPRAEEIRKVARAYRLRPEQLLPRDAA